MKHFLSSLVGVGIIGLMVFFGWAHAAGVPITLGTILFPPGQPNIQPYQIDLDPSADTVTGIPQITGGPEVFLYDDVTGKGLKKINETLVGVEVNELVPAVTFRQYVQTGEVFYPQGPLEAATCTIQGTVIIDGITADVCIDESVSPTMVTVTIPNTGIPQQYTSPVYPQPNYAPFVVGDNLYAVEPHAPTPNTFQVVKWWQWQDGTTNGVYVAPSSPSNNAMHPLISEIQLTGGSGATNYDFIELYNPTNAPYDLAGHRLVKRTASTATDTPIVIWSASTTPGVIPAHGFYLWANEDYYNSGQLSVVPNAATTDTIANDNGIALRFGPSNTGVILDSVAWGTAANGFTEGTNVSGTLTTNQSYERKMWQGIACFTAQGVGEGGGNGCDTNDNSADLEIRPLSNPQNTSSAIEP